MPNGQTLDFHEWNRRLKQRRRAQPTQPWTLPVPMLAVAGLTVKGLGAVWYFFIQALALG